MSSSGLGKIYINEEDLKKRITDLGKQISIDYKDKHPIIISILKGAFYFVADLTRQIDIPINIDFMAIGVYPGVTNETGIVRITKDLDINISKRHVLIVEDIVRTGLTLGYLIQQLEARKPESLQICTLLDNPSLRLVNIPVTYTGFNIPDIYLVGYGLDHNEDFRHLPYIAQYNE
jgi:hypoxanthine phosphoribosyltransferase